MKRHLLAAAVVLLTAPAFAQDREALARQYVNLPEVQYMMTDMFSPTTLANQFAASLPPSVPLSADKKRRIGVLMSDAMNDLRPAFERQMIAGTAETFSAAELRALIDFYSSEHGASAMRKMAPYMTRIMAQLQPEMHAMQLKVLPQIKEILSE